LTLHRINQENHVTAQARTTTIDVALPETRDVEVTITDTGEGRPILLLHGGGPLTVSGFASQFAADEAIHARVITPTHPGFNGTPRPEELADISGLAALYVALLDELTQRRHRGGQLDRRLDRRRDGDHRLTEGQQLRDRRRRRPGGP
jgi:hypothetical protein